MIFHVVGLTPAPQGSKRHVGGGRMVESSAKVRPWREAVRQEALATGLTITAQPVFLRLSFTFARPKGHRNAKGQLRPSAPVDHITRPDQGHRNAKGQLRPSAPVDHITRPDLDKLCRSTLDGLTGVLFCDDSQVAFMVASKAYALPGELEGCTIEIKLIGDDPCTQP
jgi:crossover junction endodeoxyribonuclease RusA